MTSVKVMGYRDEDLLKHGYGDEFGEVTVSEAVRFSTDRAESKPQILKDLKPDDIVELIFEDDIHRWVTVAELEQEFKGQVSRGSEPGVLEIPARLPSGDTSRGAVANVLNALRVVNVKPLQVPASELIKRVDKKLMKAPGLYQFETSLKEHGPDLKKITVKGNEPILLFIHGTFSSTAGGYGNLNPGVWEHLREKYRDRIFGYDHYTLSLSPVQNALDLVKRLPDNARLHIVTHSRGGLVGELLSRSGRKDSENLFDDIDRKLMAENEEVERALVELSKLLKSKRITVERFVRVAAPGRGTLLASKRMDTYLEVFLNVIGKLLPPGVGTVYGVLADLLLQLKKEAANPKAMPGLASMNPESNFIKMINRADVQINTDLTVISGDVEKTNITGRLALFFVDRYYGVDHDLVVDTPAMYGGTLRSEKKARFFFDKGTDVNHFNYFSNLATAEILRDALTASTQSLEGKGVKPLALAFEGAAQAFELTGRSVQKRGNLPQPVVYILPGIMGSHLAKKGNRIWLDPFDLARGGLKEHLKIGDSNIQAEALMGMAYGNLVEFLSATHEVIPFPYDWRKDIRVEAERFADALEAKLKETEQPIRIIAHSMGGLVTRTMIGRRQKVWLELTKRPGARFVMLGTPNKGSYKIPRVLFGQDKTFRTLALIDLQNSAEELLNVLVRYPGVLQLLPMDSGSMGDFAEVATWKQFPKGKDAPWVMPDPKDLEMVKGLHNDLESSTKKIPSWDPIIYVAGCASDAPMDVEIAEKNGKREIVFRGTNKGDGTVPWESGILSEFKKDNIYYMRASHGDLANHKPAFAAIYELLNDGTTAQLEKTAPGYDRGIEDRYVLRSDTVEIYPSQQDLESAVLGTAPVKHAAPAIKPVKVSVMHGNLSFCEHVVAVGHYEGDGLYNAEKQLNHHLNGKLDARHKLGRYPGPERTVDVVLNDAGKMPGGAIIVGLGKAGELTARKLSSSFANALRDFGVKAVEQGLAKNGEITLASLLIGTGGTGLSVRNSVDAMLTGVARANKSFAQVTAQGYKIRIAEIQFVELYKDQAILAVRALDRFADNKEFTITPALKTLQGGWKRIAYEEPGGWWNRITIRAAAEESASLIFSVPADRARQEDSLLEVQRRNMDRLITQAVKSPNWNQSLATALFELMIPNGLKGSFKDLSTVLFVVDKEAARYPWELLYDSRSGEEIPLVIQAGMIRQFSTSTYRDRVSDVRNKSVMVVGNPANTPIGFADLPGAEQEGTLVASKFNENGFDVQAAIHADSSTIMSQMFSKDYRVLHLAGHGVFEYEYKESEEDEPEVFTGMVLGDGVFLTASEIRKKANIPELVFINCCHLARISSNNKEVNASSTAYNDFAASLSEELINMGVKAVVAAGWAVDDAAALTFAEEFYNLLFKGRSFGEAVRGARSLTYEMHKDRTNTWGAYQCYGDPEYRLVVEMEGSQTRTKSFIDIEEAILKVMQLTDMAKTTSVQGIESIKNELHAMREAIENDHPDWLENAKLLDVLGEAFGEAFWFEEAVKYYDLATGRGKATAAIRAIEQSVNLTNRLAVREFEQNPAAYPRSKKKITNQIKKMHQLMNTLSETSERWSIIGGGYKRLAQISAEKDAKACNLALQEMETAYRKAAEYDLSSYPITNALVAAIVHKLRLGTPNKRKLAEFKAELDAALAQARRELQGGRNDFWAKTGVTDAKLTENLFKCLGGRRAIFNDKLHDELLMEYNTAWRQFGSARELNSIIEHYAFLAATLKEAKSFNESRESLEKILASLRSLYQGNASEP